MKRLAHGVVCAALALRAQAALADTDDLQALLNENVITTASTTAEKATTAPATSVTITAEDLRLYGIRSLSEAIDFLALGVVTSNPLTTPDAGARGVLLPGDAGKHFLLLVNGHAMNDPLLGAARFDQGAGIPLDVVDRIEVIVGPGSVLYGSNAMLGVINVITKRAKEYRGGHALGEYEPARSVRGGAGAGFTFDLFGQESELTTGVEYFERFGPDLYFPKQPVLVSQADGSLEQYDRDEAGDGRWGGTVEDAYFMKAGSGILRLQRGDLEVSLMASTYEHGIPYTGVGVLVDFDDPESFELERALRLDVKHHAALSTLVQLTSRLYGDTFDYQRRVNRIARYGCFRSDIAVCQFYDAGLARWAGIEERVSLNWFTDMSFVTLLGVDARMRWVSAKQEALDFDTGQPFAPAAGLIDDSAGLVSPYVQQTWSPTDWLDVNAGARLDADERFDPIASPRGAVALSPLRHTTFKAIYSQAFRAPTWYETDSSGFRQVRGGSLEPEIVRSVEGSIEQRFSTQRIMFGVFRTWWDNMIEPRLLSTPERNELQERGELPITARAVVQHRNISSIENYGWNGSYSGTLVDGRLRYGMNVTAAFTRRDTPTGEIPLPVAPQFFGNARLGYDFGGYIPSPALAMSYVGKRPVDTAFTAPYPSIPYAEPMAVFRLTLSSRVPGIEGLGYRLSGAYATASEGPYAAGDELPAGRDGPTLTPIDRLSAFVGLRYDFDPGAQSPTPEGAR